MAPGPLGLAPSVYAACVDPEVLQLVLGCLLGAERKLSIALFSLPVGSTRYVFDEHLRVGPSVRQNGVGWDRLAVKVCQHEPSKRAKVEKPHSVCSSG
jgi:hypothetical protein